MLLMKRVVLYLTDKANLKTTVSNLKLVISFHNAVNCYFLF